MCQGGFQIHRPTHAVLQVIIFIVSAPGAGKVFFTSEKSFDLSSNNRMAASPDDESKLKGSRPLRLNRQAFSGSVSLLLFNLVINNEKNEK